MSNQDSIIKKIKGLIEKAKSTDSIHESEALMLKAQEMLQKHNLEESQLIVKEKKQGLISIKIPFSEDFERIIISAISRNNFCQCIGLPYEKCMDIIGLENNVDSVVLLYGFYKGKVQQLSISSYEQKIQEVKDKYTKFGIPFTEKDLKAQFTAKDRNSFYRDYLLGCAHGISSKLREQKQKAISENSNLMALVKTNDTALEFYVSVKYPNLVTKRIGGKTKDSAAYNKGYSDGRNISQSSLGSGKYLS